MLGNIFIRTPWVLRWYGCDNVLKYFHPVWWRSTDSALEPEEKHFCAFGGEALLRIWRSRGPSRVRMWSHDLLLRRRSLWCSRDTDRWNRIINSTQTIESQFWQLCLFFIWYMLTSPKIHCYYYCLIIKIVLLDMHVYYCVYKALFSFKKICKIFHILHHIESCGTCMKY